MKVVGDVQIRVLLNITHPIVAFAENWTSHDSPLAFVDHAQLASAFEQLRRYTVLSLQTLELPVTQEATKQLAPVELEQIQYWKPTRTGDVIFNFWD